MKRTTWLLGLAAGAALAPAGLTGQTPLPLNATAPGQFAAGARGEFVLNASGAGFLTVVLRASGGEDLSLTVTDGEHQTLSEGRSDQDLGGDLGAEQVMVQIPGAGRYLVVVESLGGGAASFQVGGSFLSTSLAAKAADPDGRPSAAAELAVGASREDAVDASAGDERDWFRIRAGQAGVLTVLTRVPEGQEGDLRLELFRDGEFTEPAESSDQDQEGVMGNESATLTVTAGQVVYVRVSPSFGGGGRIAYRVASGIIPG